MAGQTSHGRPTPVTIRMPSWWALQAHAALSHLVATSAARVIVNLHPGVPFLAISASWRTVGW